MQQLETDRARAIAWAKTLIESEDGFVILDTETTGFKSSDEIVQISLLDSSGHILLHSLVRPQKAVVSPDAERVHGISNEILKHAPSFDSVLGIVESIMLGRITIAYNMDFDRRMIEQSADAVFQVYPKPKAWECAMKQFCAFAGLKQGRDGGYKLKDAMSICGIQSDGSFHDAAADCRHTLAVIRAMAASRD